MNNKQKYWEKNIKGFSGFYDTVSEETVEGNTFFKFLYKKFIFPIEKKYMMDRHRMVTDFINQHVKKNYKVADIGCGSGIYSKKMSHLVGCDGIVYAFDFAEAAISLTKSNMNAEERKNTFVRKLDITREAIPEVDVAISIGVLPYVSNAEVFLNNIIPYTTKVYFNFLDKENLLNRLRIMLPFLDARNYSYHSYAEIKKILLSNKFKVIEIEELATGKMIYAKRQQ